MRQKKFCIILTLLVFLAILGVVLKKSAEKEIQDYENQNYENTNEIKKPEIVLYDDYTEMVNNWEQESTVLALDTVKEMVGYNVQEPSANNHDRVTVAVLDTGIFPHDRLTNPRNQIVYSVDFVNDIDSPYDDNGHGTAMTGIIAAFGGEGSFYDLQSDSFIDFISVKVLDYRCRGYAEDIIQGINWVIDNKEKYNIQIINLSVGIPCYSNEWDELSEVARKAFENGILIITSSGNLRDGVFRYTPAIEPSCISVGSIKEVEVSMDNSYTVAPFTTQWETDGVTFPQVYAPGCNIESLSSNIYYKGSGNTNTDYGYSIVTGTSVSTAVVTGVAAYYMHYYPDKSVEEIYNMLFESSVSIEDTNTGKLFNYIYMQGGGDNK